ncbi:MAG TPA: PhzF family phenazine biosynthesis protein, partial [Spirochaetia bacterium]|nr:PhzF family phenazine biosynthesis protein [Spirochaetia bacterium]
ELRGYRESEIRFQTQSGELQVRRRGDLIEMDFPSRPAEPVEPPDNIEGILGCTVKKAMRSRDLMVLLDSEDDVRHLTPDFAALAELPDFGVIVTAAGSTCDFVSRFFAPRAGIPEDPVTGSSHCTLVPFWSKALGKRELRALQLSERGGELFCEDRGERVGIAGYATTYLTGSLTV